MLHCLSQFSQLGNVGAFIGDCAPSLIYDRVKRLTNEFTHSNVYCYFLSEMQDDGLTIDYSADLPRAMANTKKAIVEKGLKLLFIDTLVSFMTGDESSQKEMSPIMQRFVKLANETKCAIIINHHLRKGNGKQGDDLDEIIGSSVLTRLASVVLTMKKHDDIVTISCAKNWFTNTQTTKFKLLNHEGAITTVENLYTTNMTTVVDLFDYVKAKPKDETFNVTELMKVGNVGVATIRDLVKRLLANEIVGDLTPKEPYMDKLLIRK